jgi:hypothetical protein
MFGRPTAEAIAEASQNESVLWSDDLGVAEVARQMVKTRRVWTQLVFVETERITRDQFTELTLLLLQWNVSFTQVEPDVMLAACKRASWDPEKPPLKDVTKWLAIPELSHIGATQVCAKVLPLVWREGPLIQQRENVTRALLHAILERKGGRRTVVAIKNNLNVVFGHLDVTNVALCEKLIDRLLQRESPSGLILPDASHE